MIGVRVGDDREQELLGLAANLGDAVQDVAAGSGHAAIHKKERPGGFDEVAVGHEAGYPVDSHICTGERPVPGRDAPGAPVRFGGIDPVLLL